MSTRVDSARIRVQRLATRTLGTDYACTVANGKPKGEGESVHLYVTQEGARKRAEDLIRDEIGSSVEWEVKVASPRVSKKEMARVRRAVDDSIPEDPSDSESSSVDPVMELMVFQGDPWNIGHCPRVVVAIKQGLASETHEEWAAELVERYGSDRVVVRRFQEGTDGAVGAG